MTPDRFGNLPNRKTLVADAVQVGAFQGRLYRQAEQKGAVEPMNGGPAVRAVTHIRGDAFLAGDSDQPRNKAVVAAAVNRRGKSDDGGAHAALDE